MALINCRECGKEISDTAEFCPHCGYKETTEVEQKVQTEVQQGLQNMIQQNIQQQPQNGLNVDIQQQPQNGLNTDIQQPIVNQPKAEKKNVSKNKIIIISIIVVIVVIVGIVIATVIFNSVQEAKKPIKVDISMTSYYGYIDDILDEFDLDFDLVTAGANCYTGVQKSEFHTEKYGILHTEFRYCKSNETLVFRVYNDENDQPLREPKPGELPTFDKYGEKISSGKSDF